MTPVQAAAAATAYSDPDVSMSIQVAVYQHKGLWFVFGPPIQSPYGSFQATITQGHRVGVWELSGRFVPAMPNGLNGQEGFEIWIRALEAQGLTARRLEL